MLSESTMSEDGNIIIKYLRNSIANEKSIISVVYEITVVILIIPKQTRLCCSLIISINTNYVSTKSIKSS